MNREQMNAETKTKESANTENFAAAAEFLPLNDFRSIRSSSPKFPAAGHNAHHKVADPVSVFWSIGQIPDDIQFTLPRLNPKILLSCPHLNPCQRKSLPNGTVNNKRTQKGAVATLFFASPLSSPLRSVCNPSARRGNAECFFGGFIFGAVAVGFHYTFLRHSDARRGGAANPYKFTCPNCFPGTQFANLGKDM